MASRGRCRGGGCGLAPPLATPRAESGAGGRRAHAGHRVRHRTPSKPGAVAAARSWPTRLLSLVSIATAGARSGKTGGREVVHPRGNSVRSRRATITVRPSTRSAWIPRAASGQGLVRSTPQELRRCAGHGDDLFALALSNHRFDLSGRESALAAAVAQGHAGRARATSTERGYADDGTRFRLWCNHRPPRRCPRTPLYLTRPRLAAGEH